MGTQSTWALGQFPTKLMAGAGMIIDFDLSGGSFEGNKLASSTTADAVGDSLFESTDAFGRTLRNISIFLIAVLTVFQIGNYIGKKNTNAYKPLTELQDLH